MSILSGLKSWLQDKGEYYPECIYERNNFPLYWLVDKALSKIQIADHDVESLKGFAETGVVVYALKQKSQLNSLILRELANLKGIPKPAYSHGVNMIFWQPFDKALQVVRSWYLPLQLVGLWLDENGEIRSISD